MHKIVPTAAPAIKAAPSAARVTKPRNRVHANKADAAEQQETRTAIIAGSAMNADAHAILSAAKALAGLLSKFWRNYDEATILALLLNAGVPITGEPTNEADTRNSSYANALCDEAHGFMWSLGKFVAAFEQTVLPMPEDGGEVSKVEPSRQRQNVLRHLEHLRAMYSH